ncbi:hypothetical protein [Streptomyces humidus]
MSASAHPLAEQRGVERKQNMGKKNMWRREGKQGAVGATAASEATSR